MYFLLKICFILNYAYICICGAIYTHECNRLQRPEEHMRSPGGIGGLRCADLSVVNQTRLLCQQ